MKKTMMLIAMVVAVVFITGSVFAFGGCGMQGKDGKECLGKGKMKEEMKKELGLTAEQDKKLEACKEAHRAEAKGMHDAMKAKKDELRTAIAQPGATRAQVEPIVNQLKALEAQMTDKRIDGIFAVKAILTPEQFAKLEAMKEKRMKDWKGKHKDKDQEKGG
jgi:Spy/CpxP family protein refolding chaperone